MHLVCTLLIRVEISTPRPLLRSLGRLPPEPPPSPRTSDKSLQELFQSGAECTKIAHRRSLAIFAADSGIAGNSAMGIKFVPFNRIENRRSLAIFFAEEIAHLGALTIARFCGGAVKIAAAAAENRAILVHSDREAAWKFVLYIYAAHLNWWAVLRLWDL